MNRPRTNKAHKLNKKKAESSWTARRANQVVANVLSAISASAAPTISRLRTKGQLK